MNKLLLILLLTGATMVASAQKFIPRGGHYHAPRPRVSVGIGFGAPFWGYGYGPYYGPGWGSPFYNNWGGWGYGRPSRLSLEIADIQNEYQARIKEVRKDKSIPRAERKKEIRQHKTDREHEIIEAKRRYYKYE